MEVKQIYEITNTLTKEILGESVIVNEDLSNIVQVGEAIENAAGFDNYVRKLVDHIGKVVFKARVYAGRTPSVMMDAWEYGSIVEKIRVKLMDAEENESWKLEDGKTYDPNVFHAPTVVTKFWDNKTTYEIPISITELQVKSAFSSAEQMNSFMSMIKTAIENSLTIKRDAIIQRTVNNMMAETLYSEASDGVYTGRTGNKAVNLLKLYNDEYSAQLTRADAIHDKDFILFAVYVMEKYIDNLASYSTLFNIGATQTFTDRTNLHFVMLADFKARADRFMRSNIFNKEFTSLPNAETVSYWQGNGQDFSFDNISKIDVKTSEGHNVTTNGIVGVMFDRDALGVTNYNPRVTSNYNAKAEFWNEWHKEDAGYFNDFDENMVVFYIA